MGDVGRVAGAHFLHAPQERLRYTAHGMSLDVLAVLLCGAMWLAHGTRILYVRNARRAAPIAIAVGGLAITLCSLLLESGGWLVSSAVVAVGLVLPAQATHAAQRAVRLTRFARARAWASLAAAVRPLPEQRALARSVAIAERLASGEPIDIERALDELGTKSELARRVNRVGLLSWTGDYARIRAELAVPGVEGGALVAGLSSVVVAALGEEAEAPDLLDLYQRMLRAGVMNKRTLDTRWALLQLAAHLGDRSTVEPHVTAFRGEVPHDRILALLATAADRAGDREGGRALRERALAEPHLLQISRSRLQSRLEHPLSAVAFDVRTSAALAEISRHLHVHRALAPMAIGGGRPTPITLALALSLAGAYFAQLGSAGEGVSGIEASFRKWGLISPFARAPEAHRLLSYAWLHLDAAHLIMNLLGLLLFGRFVERSFGRLGLLSIHLAGAVAGGMAYLAFATGIGVAVGASGAVLAMFGATVVRIAADPVVRTSAAGKRELVAFGMVAVAQLLVDALWPQSSGSAHAGGMAAGALVAAVLELVSRASSKRPR